MIKNCLNCNSEFDIIGNKKYCSKECSISYKQNYICSICGSNRSVEKTDKLGNKICSKCYHNSRKEICSKCNTEKVIAARAIDGLPICSNCNRKNKTAICFICGKLKIIGGRTIDNNPLCKNCSSKSKKKICSNCDKISIIHFRTEDNKLLCNNCYSKIHKQECSICKKIKNIYTRDKNNNSICPTCYQKNNKEICCICLKEKEVCCRNKNNECICNICNRNSKKQLCSICKEVKRSVNEKNGMICENCLYLIKRFDGNMVEMKKHFNKWKPFHHKVFEYMFKNAIPEYSIAKLETDGLIKPNKNNRRLKYDYYLKDQNILIELNEPGHYSLEKFIRRFSNKTIDDYNIYVNNFKQKIELAKENNIELIIIDIEYEMNWKELEKLYEERILSSARSYVVLG